MTVLQPASWHDVFFTEDFLECASAAFTIPVDISVSTVDLTFRRWLGFAADGRSDPDWPVDVLVSVLLVGADARPVRFHRWIQRELMRLREDAIARCMRPVTPP
jgi:hypothetical protein